MKRENPREEKERGEDGARRYEREQKRKKRNSHISKDEKKTEWERERECLGKYGKSILAARRSKS